MRRHNELENLRFGNSPITNIRDYTQMFNGCKRLKSVYMPGFSAENAKFLCMFCDCPELQYIDLSGFQMSPKISTKEPLFATCPSLTDIMVHHSVFKHLQHHQLLNRTPSLQRIKVIM